MTRLTSSADRIDTRNIAEFVVVLAALALGFTAVTRVTGVDIVAVGAFYMFTPGISGLIVCLHNGIALSDVGLRIGRKRWLTGAALLPLPVLGAITALSLGVPGVTFDPSPGLTAQLGLPPGPFWTLVVLGVAVAVGATFNAVPAFGEEFGWRGYLLRELAPLGFWKASLAIGILWGIWHAPLVLAGHNYPSFPIVGVVAFTIACVAMAPLFTYVAVRSRSVLPAAVFHGVFNAVGLVGYAATEDAVLRQLVASEGGVAGVTVFGVVALAIAITGTPRLTRCFAGNTTGDSTDTRTAPSKAASSATTVDDR